MANTAQATKRAHQNKQRAAHNASQRSRLRTNIKNLRKAIEAKDTQASNLDTFKSTVSIIDKSVAKGLIHPNKAARLKSRLNHHLQVLASK